MRLRIVCREAWRDTVTGVARLPVLSALFAAVLIGGLLLDLLAVGGLIHRAERFQAAGASVLTVYAPGGIDGEVCESLNRLPGVRAAGALRDTGTELQPELLPLSRVAAYEVTRSFPEVVRSDGSGAGIHLSSDVAQAFRPHSRGRHLVLRKPAGPGWGRVYPWDDTDGRRGGYGYAALIPADAESPFDECWADLWPVSQSTRELLLLAVTPGAGDPPQIGQLNTTLGTQFDGAAEFRGRPTRWLPLGMALGSFVLGFGAVRRRRLEIASDLHAGLSREDLYLKHVLESAAWAVIGVSLTVPVTVVLIGDLPAQDRGALAGLVTGAMLIGLAAVQCGTATGVALIRQRHFFAYFQQR